MKTQRKVKPVAHPDRADHQVIIVGAGFSGLNMAVRLKEFTTRTCGCRA